MADNESGRKLRGPPTTGSALTTDGAETMGGDEIEVRSGGQMLVLSPGERVAFGRRNDEPGSQRGWGYPGRFLELSPDSHVHRIWGELLCEDGLWKVRSLGSLHPVLVVPEGRRPVELAPLRSDGAPPTYVVTQPRFEVVLTVGVESFRLTCCVRGDGSAATPERPAGGSATITLGLEMADCVTATEFAVMWELAREFRTDPPPVDPQPLSYARVQRSLGLTRRQVVGAVARVVGRFREQGLMPPEVAAEEQRSWLCRQLVAHRVFDELVRRHGMPGKMPEPEVIDPTGGT